MSDTENSGPPRDFIRDQIRADLAAGQTGPIITRFPPEPNGYLHIGHAKSICLNFGVAEEFGGSCNLRFDDTNPVTEDQKYIDAIIRDLKWLGFTWTGEIRYASDNFEQLYEWAEHLIRNGDAYVDDQSADEIRRTRGTLTEPGLPSPCRDRSVEANLALFRAMRAGDYGDGEKVLRARINMASGNMNLRDPVLYRILHAPHPRTGNDWCIYPTYDFAHGQTDAIEGVTHSLCTLEFEDHRPLYDWLLDRVPAPCQPRQYEFARLEVSHAVLSKRRLGQLVEGGHVCGWDDPRMPTLAGFRRRGIPPQALRNFIGRLAISKSEGRVEAALLDHCIRETLNETAIRRMGVLNPLKVVIETYPEDRIEELDIANDPRNSGAGTRPVPFSREIYIEEDDFMENPPRKYYRLAPGREVRLRGAYIVTCTDVIRNRDGEIAEIRCRHDPESRGGMAPDGRKVRGTLHWVSCPRAVSAEVRLFEPLFTKADPDMDFLSVLNPSSLQVLSGCKLEPALSNLAPDQTVQFERLGYFCTDPRSSENHLVFNRTVGLRDSFAKFVDRG